MRLPRLRRHVEVHFDELADLLKCALSQRPRCPSAPHTPHRCSDLKQRTAKGRITTAAPSSIVNSLLSVRRQDLGPHFFNVKPFTTATCCIPCVLQTSTEGANGAKAVKAAKPGVLKLRALRVQKPWLGSVLDSTHRNFTCAVTTESTVEIKLHAAHLGTSRHDESRCCLNLLFRVSLDVDLA